MQSSTRGNLEILDGVRANKVWSSVSTRLFLTPDPLAAFSSLDVRLHVHFRPIILAILHQHCTLS